MKWFPSNRVFLRLCDYASGMWRKAEPSEDDAIVEMCLALYDEDPGQPMSESQIRRTLAAFRREPLRGCAVVAIEDGTVVGYALLVSFWSNEYGGEICTIDELYVKASHRGRGISTSLFEVANTDRSLWPNPPVALELEVTPDNKRARTLYERLGFSARNVTLRKRSS